MPENATERCVALSLPWVRSQIPQLSTVAICGHPGPDTPDLGWGHHSLAKQDQAPILNNRLKSQSGGGDRHSKFGVTIADEIARSSYYLTKQRTTYISPTLNYNFIILHKLILYSVNMKP